MGEETTLDAVAVEARDTNDASDGRRDGGSDDGYGGNCSVGGKAEEPFFVVGVIIVETGALSTSAPVPEPTLRLLCDCDVDDVVGATAAGETVVCSRALEAIDNAFVVSFAISFAISVSFAVSFASVGDTKGDSDGFKLGPSCKIARRNEALTNELDVSSLLKSFIA